MTEPVEHSEMLMNKKTHYPYRRVDATCAGVRSVLNGCFKKGEERAEHSTRHLENHPSRSSEKEKETLYRIWSKAGSGIATEKV